VDEVIAQALARRPIPIEWEEPPDPPVPAATVQPATASLPH
jgi:ATP-dependent Lon protease